MNIVPFGFKGLDSTDGCVELDKQTLGGKGHSLVIMAEHNIRVPPGFIIPVPTYHLYKKNGMAKTIALMKQDINTCLKQMEKELGHRPLVSVRSGAPVSMPGMMDTILNVGITPRSLNRFAKRYPKRVVMDCFRRFIMMYGESVRGIPYEKFDAVIQAAEASYKKPINKMTIKQLESVCYWMIKVYPDNNKGVFPTTFKKQLLTCIEAVFESFNSPRAIDYRKINNLDQNMGTAVIVQAMVFGNASAKDSCSGVVFSRNPNTGKKGLYGDVLFNAQGEDVVAGKHETTDVAKCKAPFMGKLKAQVSMIENAYNDMVDIEFTVEKGELYILQARSAKRSSVAAFNMAKELIKRDVYMPSDAVKKSVDVNHLKGLFGCEVKTDSEPDTQGLGVGGGAFSGEFALKGEDTKGKVFIAKDTTPDDIVPMNEASAILTTTGGSTSHAAVVARAMNKPCVVGCTDLKVEAGALTADNGKDMSIVHTSSQITVDGDTGRVWIGKHVEVISGLKPGLGEFVRLWVDKQMKNKVAVFASNLVSSGLLNELNLNNTSVLVNIDTVNKEKLDELFAYLSEVNMSKMKFSVREPARPDNDVMFGMTFNEYSSGIMMRYNYKLAGHLVDPKSKEAAKYKSIEESLREVIEQ